VHTLCAQGYVASKTHFNGGVFTYAVQKVKEAHLKAQFANNTILLQVPEQLIDGWEHNEQVGFENHMDLDSNGSLKLLLEKDFVCLDQRSEDQSDNYPNPKASH
jgi:hypothetical protein